MANMPCGLFLFVKMVARVAACSVYVKLLRECRNNGYHILLVFLSLPSADMAVARVAARVTQGGHNVPENDIRRRFYESFPDEPIVATLSTQLGWSHFVEILPIKTQLAREFYAEMCRVERWPVRTLRQKISGMLYERTALSKNTEAVIKAELENLREGQMTPDMVFRDPYFLDFLGLQGAFSEKDLENAILREMERFLLELGSGFTFVARQKRMSIGKDDFYLDLLFYHRFLRRLVAIELKLDSFKPHHTGQMELYLRWLDKHERSAGEESPIGMILCAGADAEQVELLQLDGKSIRVAEYLTELPPMELLRSRLHLAIKLAREQAARRDVQPTSVEHSNV